MKLQTASAMLLLAASGVASAQPSDIARDHDSILAMQGEYTVDFALPFKSFGLDPERNNVRGDEHLISADDSAVKVFVIATNEELMIARDTKAIVEAL